MKTSVVKTYLFFENKWCTLYADVPGIDGGFIFVKGDEIRYFDSYYSDEEGCVKSLFEDEFETIISTLNSSGTKWEIISPSEDGFNLIYDFLKYEGII